MAVMFASQSAAGNCTKVQVWARWALRYCLMT